LELYGCKKSGRCIIEDDFQKVAEAVTDAHGIMLASPIFFYTVSAHTKIFMDRCQSLWVKRYWLDGVPFGSKDYPRRGFFIAAGATRGKKLFDGVLLTVRYFFDALGADLWGSLLVRGVDAEGDILKHPEDLIAAREKGKEFARALMGR
jgi:multimeric flavodoxin WrbA